MSQTLAFVFPGQGSQSVGMLAELASAHAGIRAAFDDASDGAGVALAPEPAAGLGTSDAIGVGLDEVPAEGLRDSEGFDDMGFILGSRRHCKNCLCAKTCQLVKDFTFCIYCQSARLIPIRAWPQSVCF